MLNKHQLLSLSIGALVVSNFSFAESTKTNFEKAYQSFDVEQIKADVKLISSDEFAGREPSTPGEKLTTDLLIRNFKDAGFLPGNGDSYVQSVPMVAITSHTSEPLKIGDIKLEALKDYVANSRKTQKSVTLDNSELVFVGYGINAPEYQWNDYANVDVEGKTVVVLVNDPGFATQDESIFEGNTMTYYGRWTYKYEEAARQGAKGAIIIHETKPASYGWNVIESSWSGAQYHLPSKEVNEPAVDVEMWVTVDKAKEIVGKSGFSFEALKAKAKSRNFKAVPLNLSASVKVSNEIVSSTSNNVIATIKGTEAADEHVVYMGHWDHLGGKLVDGKMEYYNGAHDNATGTAGLMHIAKAYQALNKKPRRSVTMIAVTAEEQGRLGSRYFANHPTMPLNKIVGLVNMDSLDVTGLKKDLTVVGYGKSQLEEYLAKAAKRQGRTLTPESTPERGYYYRSDHFSLAKKGVPALSAGGGSVMLNEEQERLSKQVKIEVAKCYHQMCDEYNENWRWDSLVAELQVFFEVGHMLATGKDWPNWNEGTEFKAARDAMMK